MEKLNQILNKKVVGSNIKLFDIYAPHIARKCTAGNFVILRISEYGERIPLTINDWNRERGTIRIIVKEVGKTTKELGKIEEGNCILNLIGPLGNPSEIDYFGKVVCIGGGVGVSVIYPIARALKEKGNEIISIIGVQTKEFLILREEMKKISSKIYVMTEDGSYEKKGLVSDILKEILSPNTINRVIAIGPDVMMKKISEMTRPYSIPTIVSLNSIMIDGTGMCGGCRVTVGGETRFTCVNGPEFDGHKVDFDELIHRNKRFAKEEIEAYSH